MKCFFRGFPTLVAKFSRIIGPRTQGVGRLVKPRSSRPPVSVSYCPVSETPSIGRPWETSAATNSPGRHWKSACAGREGHTFVSGGTTGTAQLSCMAGGRNREGAENSHVFCWVSFDEWALAMAYKTREKAGPWAGPKGESRWRGTDFLSAGRADFAKNTLVFRRV